MEIQTSGGQIIGILMKSKDDMTADLDDEEDRKSDHATLVAAYENEVATLTAAIETNSGKVTWCRGELPFRDSNTCRSIWVREDLEKVLLLSRYVEIGTRLALCSGG